MMARLLVLCATLLLSPAAWAADAICLNPPEQDQTVWLGKDGTMSYCTSNVPSGYTVTFDGIIDPAGSVEILEVESQTVVSFSVSGRVGEAAFLIDPSNPLVPEVAGTAFFPDPVPPFILP
jgi:hypothetical protein